MLFFHHVDCFLRIIVALTQVLSKGLGHLFAPPFQSRRKNDSEDDSKYDEEAEHATPVDSMTNNIADKSGADDEA